MTCIQLDRANRKSQVSWVRMERVACSNRFFFFWDDRTKTNFLFTFGESFWYSTVPWCYRFTYPPVFLMTSILTSGLKTQKGIFTFFNGSTLEKRDIKINQKFLNVDHRLYNVFEKSEVDSNILKGIVRWYLPLILYFSFFMFIIYNQWW